MIDYKKREAPKTTVTRDHNELDAPTGNVYEAVAILSKRADQIGEDIKIELNDKLEEFATHTESLEEIFENKEQIEVSRFYEALAKPTALAIEEWKEGQVYYRYPEDKKD
tara:strand:+ start:326 stop:655 length:330 start_codon:yes stop_codon:yes gene_type:complete